MRRLDPVIPAILLIGSIMMMTGCKKVPSETEIPAESALAIDGEYEGVILNQRIPLVADRGRIYAKSGKQVVVRNIKQLTPVTYSCEAALVLYGSFDRFIPARLTVSSSDRLILEIPPTGVFKGGSEIYYKVVNGTSSFPSASEQLAISDISVTLDPSEKLIPGMPETVNVAPGSKASLKRSHTVEHQVTLMFDSSVEGSMRVESGVLLSPLYKLSSEVKVKLEKQLGRTFKDSETFEQVVDVDGNVHRTYRLTWIDRVRTGRVKYTMNGEVSEVPFVFSEMAELSVEELDTRMPVAPTTT